MFFKLKILSTEPTDVPPNFNTFIYYKLRICAQRYIKSHKITNFKTMNTDFISKYYLENLRFTQWNQSFPE